METKVRNLALICVLVTMLSAFGGNVSHPTTGDSTSQTLMMDFQTIILSHSIYSIEEKWKPNFRTRAS